MIYIVSLLEEKCNLEIRLFEMEQKYKTEGLRLNQMEGKFLKKVRLLDKNIVPMET